MNLTGAETKVKAWKDVWSAGQGLGTVHKVEPVAAIVDQLEREYLEARSTPWVRMEKVTTSGRSK